MFADDTPLGEVRTYLQVEAYDGVRCPACTQMVKVYRRKLNSNMANVLIRFWCRYGRCWGYGLDATNDRTGDLAKCRYWGLIVEERERRPDGGRSGWWQITELGEAFIRQLARVPRYALIFDGSLLRLDVADGYTNVTDALGDKFNYNELMANL